MSELKYKVGDKVRIKSIDWYNENKNNFGKVWTSGGQIPFDKCMSKWCGKVMTISHVRADHYTMVEDLVGYWSDDMIECLVERNGKTYPYKIGDRVVLKGNNRCATITDLKYNSWGNLSYYIKVDNDKDISTDYPTELLLPYDNKIKGFIEEETIPIPKFKVGDKITNGKVTLTILTLSLDRYVVKDNFGNCCTLYFNTQDDWKTKPDPKFYIGDRVKWYNRTCYIIDIYTDEDIYTYLIKHDDYREGESFEKWVPEIELTFEDNEETPIKIEGKVITNNEMIVSVDEYILPNGYIFKDENGNVINTTKIVLEKKKEYPKTYEECLSVLGIYNGLPDVEIYNAKPSECKLFESLIRLKRCRDAYWKLYGEEMGLGKPWKPSKDKMVYSFYRHSNEIETDTFSGESVTFEFPTAEMRDFFKENFGPDIEICKELL